MSRRFTLFWMIVLMLVLCATSGAGYYAQASYLAYLQKGFYIMEVDDGAANPLVIVGTIASVLLAPLAMFALSRRISPFVVAFLCMPVWVLVSATWSDVLLPTVTIVGKTIVYALGMGLAVKHLSYRQIVGCVAATALLICGVSLYLCWSDSIFRISIGADGWRGLFAQKNRFASFALYSLLLIFPALFRRDTRTIAMITLPVLLACLILSQGKTALALAPFYMASTGAFVLLKGRPQGSKRRLLGTSLVLVTVLVMAALIIGILISLGGETFTGRVGLWRWFIDDLGDHLMVGAGGVTAPEDPAFAARAEAVSRLPTSDSSYVMLIYNQGVIGVLLYFAVIATMWTRCVRLSGDYAIFPIVTLFTYVVFAFFESDSRLTLSYAGIVVLLQLLLLEKDAQQGQPAAKARSARVASRQPGATLAS